MEFSKNMFQAGSSIFGNSGIERDIEEFDCAETLQIGASCLLSMLKHGRAGVPLEVMGLMLGSHLDKYTIRLSQVFAMPQSGTGVNVDAIDHPFQVNMTNLIEQLGRTPISIGWYHSHPGFGCWLSNVDISTHQAFEKIDKRAIAVVVDPIQSVKGKVVIDAFRSIESNYFMSTKNSRLVTSTSNYEVKPTITALLRGLNRYYYSVRITYHITDLERKMLQRITRKSWTERLHVFKSAKERDVASGEFDFEDIKKNKTDNKAKRKLEEFTNEEYGETSKKDVLLKNRVDGELRVFSKEINSLEEYEIKMNKEKEFIKEYLENKKRNDETSEHFKKDYGFDEKVDKEGKESDDVNNENVENNNEMETTIPASVELAEDTSYKQKNDNKTESVEDYFKEALERVKISRVGNVNHLRHLNEKLKALVEAKTKEILEYSRMCAVFGNKNAKRIYQRIVCEHR
eukprot:GAHX01001003.1.p1 GENE.GAHX01001003.1~~GAHX01001003.1.p1  ORF type:complete len:458 (-),score=114.86 GAHX01001003.1:37-1410(-)